MENYEIVKNLATCNLEFALALYRIIDEKDNIFFSPASIHLALAMTRLGAENKTHEQLTKGLHLHLMQKEDDVRSAYGRMIETLNSENQDLTLRTANRMYVEKSFRIINEFKLLLNQIFKTEIGELDFINEGPKSAAEINKWVEEYTNSKIKDVIDPQTLTPNTRVILVNAVYFKGTWKEQFEESLTKPMDFHTSTTSCSKVDMMYIKDKFSYAESDQLDCKVLLLPYNFSSLDMMILLPNQVDGIDKMVPKLNAQVIEGLSKDLSRETVTVHLPKFKLETSYELKSALKKLGIEDLFSAGDADLRTFSGKKELYVSAVLHKTFLNVDEKGTEAAAATVVMMCGYCMEMPRPEKVFTADRPFLFLIRDSVTGIVVFMGCFRNPSASK